MFISQIMQLLMKNIMTRIPVVFAMTLLLYISSYVYGQSVILTENPSIEFMQISHINKMVGTISNVEKTLLKVDLYDEIYTIDETGNRIAGKSRLIQNLTRNIQVIDLPRFDIPNVGIFDGKVKYLPNFNEIIIWFGLSSSGNNYSETIRFYDISENKISQSCTYSFEEFPVLNISNDGMIFTILSGMNLHLYTRNDEGYDEKILGPYKTRLYPMLSRSGKRIIMIENTTNDNQILNCIDQQSEGWSQEIPIQVPSLNVDGTDVEFDLVAMANDGKTLILESNYHSSLEAKHHYLAVVHEEENGWSKPKFVGKFDYQKSYKLSSSEDGRVIALQQTKRYSDLIGPLSFDAYLFIQNADGQWRQNKVNPEGVEVMQDILLSGDGSKLIWNPSVTSSIPYSSNLR